METCASMKRKAEFHDIIGDEEHPEKTFGIQTPTKTHKARPLPLVLARRSSMQADLPSPFPSSDSSEPSTPTSSASNSSNRSPVTPSSPQPSPPSSPTFDLSFHVQRPRTHHHIFAASLSGRRNTHSSSSRVGQGFDDQSYLDAHILLSSSQGDNALFANPRLYTRHEQDKARLLFAHRQALAQMQASHDAALTHIKINHAKEFAQARRDGAVEARAGMQTEIDDLVFQLGGATEGRADAQTEIDKLKSQLNDATQARAEAQTQIGGLSSRLNDAAEERADMKMQIDSLTTQLEATTNENENISGESVKKDREIKILTDGQKNYQSAVRKNNALKSDISHLQERIDDLYASHEESLKSLHFEYDCRKVRSEPDPHCRCVACFTNREGAENGRLKSEVLQVAAELKAVGDEFRKAYDLANQEAAKARDEAAHSKEREQQTQLCLRIKNDKLVMKTAALDQVHSDLKRAREKSTREIFALESALHIMRNELNTAKYDLARATAGQTETQQELLKTKEQLAACEEKHNEAETSAQRAHADHEATHCSLVHENRLLRKSHNKARKHAAAKIEPLRKEVGRAHQQSTEYRDMYQTQCNLRRCMEKALHMRAVECNKKEKKLERATARIKELIPAEKSSDVFWKELEYVRDELQRKEAECKQWDDILQKKNFEMGKMKTALDSACITAYSKGKQVEEFLRQVEELQTELAETDRWLDTLRNDRDKQYEQQTKAFKKQGRDLRKALQAASGAEHKHKHCAELGCDVGGDLQDMKKQLKDTKEELRKAELKVKRWTDGILSEELRRALSTIEQQDIQYRATLNEYSALHVQTADLQRLFDDAKGKLKQATKDLRMSQAVEKSIDAKFSKMQPRLLDALLRARTAEKKLQSTELEVQKKHEEHGAQVMRTIQRGEESLAHMEVKHANEIARMTKRYQRLKHDAAETKKELEAVKGGVNVEPLTVAQSIVGYFLGGR